MDVIHLSSDKVLLLIAGERYLLERNDIDKELGPLLVELDRKTPFSQLLVINGPGGFTNLRVGTLALNLLNTLKDDQISFFSLSKLELYKAFVQRGALPRYGCIVLGQKSNVWIWDFHQDCLVATVKKSELFSLCDQYALFIDEVFEEGYFEKELPAVALVWEADRIGVVYKGIISRIEFVDLLPVATKKLIPNYMIEPNIS